MTTVHSRQNSFASSFVSTSANGLGISARNINSMSSGNTPNSKNSNSSKSHPLQIGPWKLGRTLGKGSTGRVLLASNVTTGQKAAVKVVSKSILNNMNTHDGKSVYSSSSSSNNSNEEANRDSAGLSYGIEREIIIMKLLNHKNVLRLYDVWETDKALYLVLEYVEGGELFDLLVESGPLPEQTAIEFFKQIILGASYCHNLGICHRDLKPENLLLDKNLNIKIADFGMAALESNDRLLETSCGSPHYAAPEIVRGLQYHGSASDVWSCGVILFALLTGRLPFDDENIRDLLLKVQKGEYEIVEENISYEAKDLIAKMLTVDPEKRIKTKDILNHPLIRKYPFTKQDQEDYMNLPSPKSAIKPVNSEEQIDKQILENLVILWHGKDKNAIVKSLLSPEPNPEKTFYSLLLRYRHEHNQGNLVRSSSVISKVSSHSSSGTPKRRKSQIRASSAHKRPVSFQSNKSLTEMQQEQQVFTTPTKSNRASLLISNGAAAPPLPKGAYDEVMQQKRGMKVSPEKRLSMQSTSNKRQSMLFMNDAPVATTNNRNSVQMNRRTSTRMKRNSITSKVLNTYTKLASIDNQKDMELKNYGKRTSADFAALCDMLFSKEAANLAESNDENDVVHDVVSKRRSKLPSLPSSSSFATLSKFIMDAEPNVASKKARRQSKRLSSTNTTASNSRKRTSMISAIKRQSSFDNYFNSPTKSTFELETTNAKSKSNKKRTASNPMERISRILNANDVQQIQNNNTRSISAFGTAPDSAANALGPPPKPISRLDPRYKAYDDYQKRSSLDAARALAQAEREEKHRQKVEIRRKKIEEARIQAEKEEEEARLKAEEAAKAAKAAEKAKMEAELAERQLEIDDEEDEDTDLDILDGLVDDDFTDHTSIILEGGEDVLGGDDVLASSPSTVKRYDTTVRRPNSGSQRPTTLADVKVPEITRRSKHFPGNSNRLSILSIYSSGVAPSSTNLASLLKEDGATGKRKSKNPRLSMLFEDQLDTVDMNFTLPDINLEADIPDNESFNFVNNQKASSNKKYQNRQSLLLASSPNVNNNSNTDAANGNAEMVAPSLQYKDSKDTLISNNPEDNLYKSFKLPEIPGSPIKDDAKRRSMLSNANQRMSSSKYDHSINVYSDAENKVAASPLSPTRHAPPPPKADAIRASKVDGKLEFETENASSGATKANTKPRKPLGDIDQATKQRMENKENKQQSKSSFFRKLSFGKQQQQHQQQAQVSKTKDRNTSLTKAFLSLFQAEGHDFEKLELDTILSQQDLFEALNSLFVSWKQHGINKLQIEREMYKMTANISKDNALGLKQCKIGVSVLSSTYKSVSSPSKKSPKSTLVFSNLKGSSKSFKKLVKEIENILDRENVLVA